LRLGLKNVAVAGVSNVDFGAEFSHFAGPGRVRKRGRSGVKAKNGRSAPSMTKGDSNQKKKKNDKGTQEEIRASIALMK